MKKYIVTILGKDRQGRICETCFAVSASDDLQERERNGLIRRAAPIMAALQGLVKTGVEIETIEEEK